MKKYIALILIVFSIVGMSSVAIAQTQNDTSAADSAYSVLKSIGIIPSDTEWELSGGITRSQMAVLVARFLGSGDVSPVQTSEFTDVLSSDEYSGYIDYVYRCGIISLNETRQFYPDRYVSYNETIKMVVSALGGDVVAGRNGGYPVGYLSTASSLNILSGIHMQTIPSMGEISILLNNALKAPVYKANYYVVQNGKALPSNIELNKEATALRVYHNISVVNINVISEELKTKIIDAEILSVKNKSEDFKFVAGQQCRLLLNESLENGNLAYIKAEAWVKGENELVYIKPHKNIEIIWGAIDEVNRESTVGKTYDIRYIEELAIKDGEDYIDVAENCRFFMNDNEILSGGVTPIGNYARLVLDNDEIIALEIWELKEGGVITSTSEGIVYSQGIKNDIHLNEYDEAKNVKVIINNKPSNKILLSSGIVFDWFYNEKNRELLIVTSGYSVTDEFASVMLTDGDVNAVTIGKDTYAVSTKYGVYYKKDGNYYGVASKNDIIGQTVTAYVDYANEVRYIEVFKPTAVQNEFYGIVLGYQKGDIYDEDDKLRIARVVGTEVDIIECSMNEKKPFPDGINIENVLDEISNAGDKKAAMKTADVLYKFRVNSNNKILNIENPTRFDACPQDGVTPTEISGGANPYLYSPRMYFEPDTVFCAYYLLDGEIKVKSVYTSDIAGRSLDNCRLDMFSNGDTSKIEFVLVRGDVHTICNATQTKVQYGLLTDMRITFDSATREEGKTVRIDGSDYLIKGELSEKIPRRAFVSYGTNPVFADGKICILDTYSLEGSPSSWNVLQSGTGIREGVVERVDGNRLYLESGSRIYFDNNAKYYKMLKNDRFANASKSEIQTGDHVYFLYEASEIQIIIIMQ